AERRGELELRDEPGTKVDLRRKPQHRRGRIHVHARALAFRVDPNALGSSDAPSGKPFGTDFSSEYSPEYAVAPIVLKREPFFRSTPWAETLPARKVREIYMALVVRVKQKTTQDDSELLVRERMGPLHESRDFLAQLSSPRCGTLQALGDVGR